MNILILSATASNFSTRALVKAGRKRGHKVTVMNPNEMFIQVSDKSGHDKVHVQDKRIYKYKFDAIIPRIGKNLKYGCTIVRQLNKNMGVYSTATASGLLRAANKLESIQIASENRIRVPKTTYFNKATEFQHLIKSVGGQYPIVCKTVSGSQGTGVFLIESNLGGSTTLQSFAKKRINILLQEFIHTAKKDENKNDLRLYVCGNKVVAAYKRYSLDSDFRSNYTISKSGEKVNPTDEEKRMAIDAARATGLSVAGVDIARNINDNLPYFIEINGNASLAGITRVTKVDVATEIIKHVETAVKADSSSLSVKIYSAASKVFSEDISDEDCTRPEPSTIPAPSNSPRPDFEDDRDEKEAEEDESESEYSLLIKCIQAFKEDRKRFHGRVLQMGQQENLTMREIKANFSQIASAHKVELPADFIPLDSQVPLSKRPDKMLLGIEKELLRMLGKRK